MEELYFVIPNEERINYGSQEALENIWLLMIYSF
jgi:hypothetical protein